MCNEVVMSQLHQCHSSADSARSSNLDWHSLFPLTSIGPRPLSTSTGTSNSAGKQSNIDQVPIVTEAGDRRLEANIVSRVFCFDVGQLMSCIYGGEDTSTANSDDGDLENGKRLLIEQVDRRLECVQDPSGWMYRVRLASNCFEQNLVALPVDMDMCLNVFSVDGDDGGKNSVSTVLCTTRPIEPHEELCYWPSFELHLMLGIPFLVPSNIINDHCYQCNHCGQCFTQPNPLKIHLMFVCQSSKGQNNVSLISSKFRWFELFNSAPSLSSSSTTTATTTTNATSTVDDHSRRIGRNRTNQDQNIRWRSSAFVEFRHSQNSRSLTPLPVQSETVAAVSNSSNQRRLSSTSVQSMGITSYTSAVSRSTNSSSTNAAAAATTTTAKMPSSISAKRNYPISFGQTLRSTSPPVVTVPPLPSSIIHRKRHQTGVTLSLEQHRKLHTCSYCGKVYTRKYGLKIHIRTHTGLKPLSCRYCGRSFSDPSNLNKHIRLHTQQQQQQQQQQHQNQQPPQGNLLGLSPNKVSYRHQHIHNLKLNN